MSRLAEHACSAVSVGQGHFIAYAVRMCKAFALSMYHCTQYVPLQCEQVEASQSMIRIVGLSATLPNYKDVASFLGVTESGLFYFDASYRPVPLAMQFIGATDKNIMASKSVMDEVCFQKVGSLPCCISHFDVWHPSSACMRSQSGTADGRWPLSSGYRFAAS